jgi:hypothetical protein
MPSSGTLHRVALVRTDVSENCSASIIRVTRIGELGTMLVVTSNRRKLQKILCHPDDGGATFLRNVGSYKSHTRNISEDGILHSRRRENLKS